MSTTDDIPRLYRYCVQHNEHGQWWAVTYAEWVHSGCNDVRRAQNAQRCTLDERKMAVLKLYGGGSFERLAGFGRRTNTGYGPAIYEVDVDEVNLKFNHPASTGTTEETHHEKDQACTDQHVSHWERSQ